MTGQELLLDDASAQDELAPIISAQHQEFPMPDTDAVTRYTVYVKDGKALAEALDLPLDTDPSKIMRVAREKLTALGLAKPLTVEEWLKLGQRFYQTERA